MIEREDGAYFGILLHQIIDTHREAAIRRRKWRHAFTVVVFVLTLVVYL